MAKTLMISDVVYERLKEVKGEKSFSEVISELLVKPKCGADIAKFYGILKEDKEFDKIQKEYGKKWGEWTARYA